MTPPSSPRNTIIGHLIGVVVGWLALIVFGLTTAPTLSVGLDWPRAGAAAVALGIANALMVLLRVQHPPASATAMIVPLGLLSQPWQLAVMMAAVVLLTFQAFVINRLAGIRYPVWAPRADPSL